VLLPGQHRAAKGIDLGIITPFLFNRHAIYSFAVKPGSTIRELGDLRSKRIGVPSLGDEAVWFVRATLQDQGFSGQDATLIAVGPVAQAAKALISDEVDALSPPDIQYGLMRALGFTRNLIAIEARKDKLQIGPNQKWGEYSRADWDFSLQYIGVTDKIKDPGRFYTNDLIGDINAFDQGKIIEQARAFVLK